MKRQRLGEQGWRKVLERFAASGQTVSVFCTREGVSPSNFYQWRARLNSTLREARPSGFVDLGLVAATKDSANSNALEVRLELGAGVVLHVVRR